MNAHLVEMIVSTAMVAGWLAVSVRLLVAVHRRQRRPPRLADDAEQLARLERATVRDRVDRHEESDDPHVQWLGAGGAV